MGKPRTAAADLTAGRPDAVAGETSTLTTATVLLLAIAIGASAASQEGSCQGASPSVASGTLTSASWSGGCA